MSSSKKNREIVEPEVVNESPVEVEEVIPEVKEPPKGNLMYVGPTIPGLIQNRVYTEIPEAAKEVASSVPEMMNLFIPVREYSNACVMLREKKGYVYSAFMKVYASKGGK